MHSRASRINGPYTGFLAYDTHPSESRATQEHRDPDRMDIERRDNRPENRKLWVKGHPPVSMVLPAPVWAGLLLPQFGRRNDLDQLACASLESRIGGQEATAEQPS